MFMSAFQELFNKLDFKTISKRAWQGAAIAFALLATWIMLLMAKGEDFGLWVALPFTTVTLGGAGGGVFFSLVEQLWQTSGWRKAFAVTLSIAVYLTIFWLSLVYALSLIGEWN
jgi:hypothetical protein